MGGRRTLPRGLCRVVWKQAAGIVARLLRADGARRGGASIKTLTLAPGIAAKKATHAIVCETLKHIPLLKLVLEDAGVPLTDDVFADGRKRAAAAADDDEAETEDDHADDASEDADADADPDDATAAASRVLHRSTAYVLGYEVLFGAGVDPEPDGRALPPDESAVVAASPALRKALRRRLKSAGASTADAFLLAQPGGRALAEVPFHSRHARVNALKISTEAATRALSRLRPAIDPHVPNLLVFPPGTDLHDHPMVRDGRLILQGKASCLPAAALAPEPGWEVLDCCAAPGNKTTHLAALVGVEGKVRAFDADARRLKRLKANCALAGAGDIVTARCQDFLTLDPEAPEYAAVRGVLLDPSCSGSGTAGTRGDYLIAAARGETEPDANAVDDDGGDVSRHPPPGARVAALADFQTRALRHALKFPGAERISYSTCSVHAEENERVVRAVLPEATRVGYALVEAIPTWRRRGTEGEVEGAERLLRADQFEDDMEGFFVAVFARPTPPGAERAAKAAKKAEEAAKKAAEEAKAAKRAREDGSAGVRAARPLKKKKGKRAGGPLFR